MGRYGVGLVGYGGFGRFLRGAWSKVENAEVVAVADQNAACDPGDVEFHLDWNGLVSDDRVDVVAIATPPASHAAIARAALSSGKHVLVEKPVATSLEDAAQILEDRDRFDRIVTVDFMLRFNPIMETLHRWCRSGCFGKLRRVAVENYAQDESLPPNHWFWDRTVSGGILVEHAVHFFDLVQWCCGSVPARIEGVAVRRSPRQEDRVMASIIHEDGMVATHYHSFSGPDFFEHTSMRFVFDLLRLEVHGWIPMEGQVAAILTPDNEHKLSELPGFRLTQRQSDAKDRSISATDSGASSSAVDVHGTRFSMIGSAVGDFALAQSKTEAYEAALCALMSDFLKSVADPGHRLRVTLEDGVTSLEIALAARKHAGHTASP